MSVALHTTKVITPNVLTDEQRAILILWKRVNTSLSAFYKLIEQFKSAQNALQKPVVRWAELKIHAKHRSRHANAIESDDMQFIKDIERHIQVGDYGVLFLEDDYYPQQLKQLFDPPPVLFYRGNVARLSQAQIAIVGSRKPSTQAQKLTFDMAQYLAQSGYVITSGLAQGVDAQAHLGALSQSAEQAGRTVGVMGTGIDVCYPKQHQSLFDKIVNEGGCIITELFSGTPPNKHTFPRRNRIVAGLSLGAIVTEAALKSGSLITARLTSEQGKQVFALPSSIDNHNAEGCHHLIREGATLIYHPDHVINDLSTQIISPMLRQSAAVLRLQASTMPLVDEDNKNLSSQQTDTHSPKPSTSVITSNGNNTVGFAYQPNYQPNVTQHTLSQPEINIPEHLSPIFVHIDLKGLDLDTLVVKTQLDTPSLLSQLMELELLGLIVQVGGRYKRV